VFTYFYTAVQFNPVDQADNLRKYGGDIPGTRPGAPPAPYLDRLLTRLTPPGSLYLAAVSVLPRIFLQYCRLTQATSLPPAGRAVVGPRPRRPAADGRAGGGAALYVRRQRAEPRRSIRAAEPRRGRLRAAETPCGAGGPRRRHGRGDSAAARQLPSRDRTSER